MIGGVVVGGLLGNQIGCGNGCMFVMVGGVVVGGYGGYVVENYYSCDIQYCVNVCMDNGMNCSFMYKVVLGFQVGECVYIENGMLVVG